MGRRIAVILAASRRQIVTPRITPERWPAHTQYGPRQVSLSAPSEAAADRTQHAADARSERIMRRTPVRMFVLIRRAILSVMPDGRAPILP